MKLVDSCGWLHVFKNTALADTYLRILQQTEPETIVPTIVLYEVAKVLKRDVGESVAMECALRMQQSRVIGLSDVLALEAADVALERGLAMADAIIYATAIRFGAQLYTSDIDLKGCPGVQFITMP
ncbi:MAG: type II toxin-antitoxin system VapC family toxin [Mariprofundus sp.]|nr:type II toxin-antitoxin system VapC family toxin [Mariprofundus sp.]